MKKVLALLLSAIALVAICGCTASGNDAKRYAAYVNLIDQYEQAYGQGAVSSDGYISGLAYAELVDFGDGSKRLVTAYLDEDSMAYQRPMPDNYIIEVWNWTDKGDAPLESFKIAPASTNGGFAFVSYASLEGKTGIYTNSYQMSDDHATSVNSYTLFGMGENGLFGKAIAASEVTTTNPYTAQAQEEYTIDGAPVDRDAYQNAPINKRIEVKDVFLIGNPSELSGTAESVALTKRVLAGESTLEGTYALGADKATKLFVTDTCWAVSKGEQTIAQGMVKQYNDESITPFDGAICKIDYLLFNSSDGTLHMLTKTDSGYELSAAKHILDGNPSLSADGTYEKTTDKVDKDGIALLEKMRTFSTSYYTITIPLSEPAPQFACNPEDLKIIQPDDGNGSPLGAGCNTNVDFNGDGIADFCVSCLTDNWGPQGMLYSLKIGPASGKEGWSVWVYHAFTDKDREDRTATYAKYVSLK